MLSVGEWVHGHANGAFGRDHYECAQLEILGRDYAIFRTKAGRPLFATVDMFKTLERSRDMGFDPDWCKGSWSAGCQYDPNWDPDN